MKQGGCCAQATASGMLSVYFYDTLAGSQPLEPTTIAARANPQVGLVSLPRRMLLQVLHTICASTTFHTISCPV